MDRPGIISSFALHNHVNFNECMEIIDSHAEDLVNHIYY